MSPPPGAGVRLRSASASSRGMGSCDSGGRLDGCAEVMVGASRAATNAAERRSGCIVRPSFDRGASSYVWSQPATSGRRAHDGYPTMFRTRSAPWSDGRHRTRAVTRGSMSSPQVPVSAGPSPRRFGGALSIHWKLPLVITAVLAAGLAAFLAFTYVTLARRSEPVVRDRFAHASKQVARSVQEAIAFRRQATEAAAGKPELTRLLLAAETRTVGDSTAAAAVLARLVAGRDSLAVMLTDIRGRVLASAGKPLPAGVRLVDVASVAPPSSDDAVGAARISPIVHVGDRALFWIVAPITSSAANTTTARSSARVGYIVQPFWVTGPRDASRNLRELTREDLNLYLRNIDGTAWTYAPGLRAPSPTRRDSTRTGVWYERPKSGRLLAAEAPIAGTPWLVVIESPERTLLARLRTTVEQLAWMSLLILAAGAALAWVTARRITRPLVALTTAADQVATGTYEHSIPVTSGDEIGRLTTRFHEMAEQVAEARRELE